MKDYRIFCFLNRNALARNLKVLLQDDVSSGKKQTLKYRRKKTNEKPELHQVVEKITYLRRLAFSNAFSHEPNRRIIVLVWGRLGEDL